ncbi:MAG: Maf family protein [Bryobacterales bacterium]|nr:Maf family protein [Bryobacteraceae bacterium]MDW8353840.1 Maf family protein [Bryobacterales bacterium]
MLVLASRSPRRREILQRAGIPFRVQPADVDETWVAGESPSEHVLRLAHAKAAAVEALGEEIVLGADTTVVLDGEILAKPQDPQEAVRMLRRLSGREHAVLTGVCLRRGPNLRLDVETTRVWFAPLTEREIQEYVASGEPLDKAGAYAIQGLASKFVERIEGCYFNVVGLPVALVYRRLKEIAARA